MHICRKRDTYIQTHIHLSIVDRYGYIVIKYIHIYFDIDIYRYRYIYIDRFKFIYCIEPYSNKKREPKYEISP